MAAPRFVTDAQGERVGVLLDLETYERMRSSRNDPEMLSDMTGDELTALAESELAPGQQTQLRALQKKNSEQTLSKEETERLERLLEQIDALNILKARARYTLHLKSTPRE